jgi:GNAT superfamily N-acetyltransferase
MKDLRKDIRNLIFLEVNETHEEVDQLRDVIHANQKIYCDGWIPEYLNDKMPGTYIILKDREFGTIFGFAIISHKKDVLKIFVICSNNQYKGAGTILMDFIKTYALRHSIQKIRLSSVPDAILFYKKMGFKQLKPTCEPYELCEMVYFL